MKSWDEQVDEIFKQDELLTSVLSDPCKRHNPFQGGYIEHIEYMEEKIKHGAKQRRCPKCGYWYYKSEY
jgi:hypothetical protein